MSVSAPVAANSGTSVLPMSSTSGGLFWASAVLILVLMLSHCWIWTFTFAPVAFSKAALTAWVAAGLRSPSISHTVSVLEPVDCSALPPSSPQAVTVRAIAAAPPAKCRGLDIFMCVSPEDGGGGGLVGAGEGGGRGGRP